MLGEQLIRRAQDENRLQLTEVESKELLKEAGIPAIETCLATTKTKAVFQSKRLGFPVVLKISSPDILHKSDAGGVRLGLTSATQVGNAYNEVISSAKQELPQARIEGVSVQKMASPGVEVIIGISRDSLFGPVLMFGLGGILVEVLKDVSFRIVPVGSEDAAEMIREIKGFPVLQGYRGQEGVDIPALEGLLVKVSKLAERYQEIKELDLNPVLANRSGVMALDARIVLEA